MPHRVTLPLVFRERGRACIKIKKTLARVFRSNTIAIVISKGTNPKDKAIALRLFPATTKTMLNQTIPLRVPAVLKLTLNEMAKSDKRSLNAFINLHLEALVKAHQTPHTATLKTKPKTKPKAKK